MTKRTNEGDENGMTAVLDASEAAVKSAEEVLTESKAVTKSAKDLTTKVEGLMGPSWEQDWKLLIETVKAIKEGKSLFPREELVKAMTEINDRMHADRAARGLTVGGHSASSMVAKACDSWNKDFDFKSFQFHAGLVDVKAAASDPMAQRSLMDTAMSAQPRTDLQRAFQHAYMDLMILDMIMKNTKRQNYRGPRVELPKSMALCDYLRSHMFAEITGKAAVDPNDVANTADWVPTVFAPDFRELLFLELRVEALFPIIAYDGPGDTWRMPLHLTNAIGHLVANTFGTTYGLANPFAATDPVQMGTQLLDGKKDFVFQKHRGRVIADRVLDEDSVVPVVPLARQNILMEIGRAAETAIINGQKSGEIDTGGGGVAALPHDARNSWDGLRKHVRLQTGSTFGAANAALTVTMLMQNGPILGGKYMVNPSQGAIILAPVNLFHIITDTAVWTAEKYGPQATVFTGALAAVGGKPIVISEHVPVNLNASGIFDAVTTDRTVALIVHRPSFMGVEKRAIEVGTDYYRASDITDTVGMRRVDWGKLWGNSEKCVVEITNLKTS